MFTGGELRERMRSDELRRRVAGTLLGIEPGQRLPTIRQLASRHRASIGATQETLARLEAEGGVAIDRRGRLGATLRSRSIGALWAAAEGVPLIVSLPLPNTPRTEGLATAIKSLLTDAGVEVYLVFSRGSRHRLVELRQGRCHLVVLSALAARELCGSGERVLLELPAPSFVREHRVYYADRAEGMNGPPRVVIDRDRALRLEAGERLLRRADAGSMLGGELTDRGQPLVRLDAEERARQAAPQLVAPHALPEFAAGEHHAYASGAGPRRQPAAGKAA